MAMRSDDAFGHWLAGLVDGEGSFWINKQYREPGRRAYACRFELGLRADDAAVLDEIRDRLGIGYTYEHVTGRSGCVLRRWLIASKADCLALVSLLDRYPLRSKKARDYAIWREAVQLWCEHNGTRDWAPMGAIRDALMASRAFPAEAAT